MNPAADIAADRRAVLALQALVVGLPLLQARGGAWPHWVAFAVVVTLLVVTARTRHRRGGGPRAPGVPWLVAFVALALATTLPVPPTLLEHLAPATAQLYRQALPGWPEGGGWSPWRTAAIDPYGTWSALVPLSIGVGAFVVIVAYPWRIGPRGEEPHTWVLERLLLTLLVTGALLSALVLLAHALGSEAGLGWRPPMAALGAAALVALAFFVSVLARVVNRIIRAADVGRGIGVRPRRAWPAALITHQRRLWAPLCAGAVLALVTLALLLLLGRITIDGPPDLEGRLAAATEGGDRKSTRLNSSH